MNGGHAPRCVLWAHNSHVGDACATELGAHDEWNLGQMIRSTFGPNNTFLLGFGTCPQRSHRVPRSPPSPAPRAPLTARHRARTLHAGTYDGTVTAARPREMNNTALPNCDRFPYLRLGIACRL